jgi:hypothetical protein
MRDLIPEFKRVPSDRPLSIWEPAVQITGAALAIWIQQSRDSMLASSRAQTHNQKLTVAAMQIAARKLTAFRS